MTHPIAKRSQWDPRANPVAAALVGLGVLVLIGVMFAIDARSAVSKEQEAYDGGYEAGRIMNNVETCYDVMPQTNYSSEWLAGCLDGVRRVPQQGP